MLLFLQISLQAARLRDRRRGPQPTRSRLGKSRSSRRSSEARAGRRLRFPFELWESREAGFLPSLLCLPPVGGWGKRRRSPGRTWGAPLRRSSLRGLPRFFGRPPVGVTRARKGLVGAMGDRATCVSSLCLQIFLKQRSLFWLKPRYSRRSSILVFRGGPPGRRGMIYKISSPLFRRCLSTTRCAQSLA